MQALSASHRVTAYDLADPYHPKPVDDLAPYAVNAVAVHPGGTMLAVARDSSTELWDLEAPVTTRMLAVRSSPYSAVASFGPDGRTMTVFRNDTREIELLDIRDPRNPEVLTVFRPRVEVDSRFQVIGPPPVYSADGRLLAVLDGDRTVRLWDISDPREPARVTAFDFGNQVGALSMSADGKQLFAATEENVVQRRHLDVDDVARRICAIAHPRITAAEWREHFQNLPYQPPCR